MSDSKVNNNLMNSQDIIQPPNRVKELTPYDPRQSITPNTELLIEFLTAVMTKDYELALRYCTEILNREPDNLTALEFYPLIVEKLEMIENEELDSSLSDSSESSISTTSSSSCSEKKIFHKDITDQTSLYEWGISHSSFMESPSQEKINEAAVPSMNRLKKECTNEKIKTQSKISLEPKPKKTFLPNAELHRKKPRDQTPPPANLLIHPTETITLIGDNTSDERSKTLFRPKQERRTPHVSQQQPSPKILLHTTPTVTFPKNVSIQNSERSGNPQ